VKTNDMSSYLEYGGTGIRQKFRKNASESARRDLSFQFREFHTGFFSRTVISLNLSCIAWL